MAKFRKKPVIIDAWKLNLNDTNDTIRIYEMIHNVDVSTMHLVASAYINNLVKQKGGLPIPTLEGEMLASDGDFIIKGVNGEYYPCKPDIFEKTYEAVE
jgi:hypothetical protein|nr:MAG TPA: PGDYG protein [Caudoviricetes sp.]